MELSLTKALCKQDNLPCAVVDVFGLGGAGSIELAELIMAESLNQQFNPLYKLDAPLSEKLEDLSKNVYRARKVVLSESAQQSCAWIERHGFGSLPVCVAKTQYSLSDDPHAIGVPEDFDMHVNEIELRAGAGFIVAKMGAISTMPGLPSKPNAVKIDVDEQGHIFNIV